MFTLLRTEVGLSFCTLGLSCNGFDVSFLQPTKRPKKTLVSVVAMRCDAIRYDNSFACRFMFLKKKYHYKDTLKIKKTNIIYYYFLLKNFFFSSTHQKQLPLSSTYLDKKK